MELFVNLNIYCYIFKLYNVFKFVILSISLLTLPNLIVGGEGGGGVIKQGGVGILLQIYRLGG